jgi:hypothetical protein
VGGGSDHRSGRAMIATAGIFVVAAAIESLKAVRESPRPIAICARRGRSSRRPVCFDTIREHTIGETGYSIAGAGCVVFVDGAYVQAADGTSP